MISVSVCVRKTWPLASQLRLALGIVEQLAVEDDGDGAVLVEDRLLAVGEADDGEAAVGEAEAGADQDSRRRQGRDARALAPCAAATAGIRLTLAGEVDDSSNAAHGSSSIGQSGDSA